MNTEGRIRYVIGDATQPRLFTENKPFAIITHVCNDIGAWGAGFTGALSARWPNVEQAYRQILQYRLGDVHLVKAEEQQGIWVANLIGQHGVGSKSGMAPVRYWAIETGLARLAEKCRPAYESIHMPRIGCGLAGGLWYAISEIIARTLVANGYSVTVYDLEPQQNTFYDE